MAPWIGDKVHGGICLVEGVSLLCMFSIRCQMFESSMGFGSSSFSEQSKT